jgi:hypothetical protein
MTVNKPLVIHQGSTVNPVGSPSLHMASGPVHPPAPDMTAKQDPSHNQEQFPDDLSKVTRSRGSQAS